MAPSLVGCFKIVAVAVVIMTGLTYSGVFDKVNVELGYEHYAEGIYRGEESLLPMPVNTMVNLGYITVGITWIKFINAAECEIFSLQDKFMFNIFNVMSVFYGFIQALRIITQSHHIAVMDQWVTLPFFAWVINWSYQSRGVERNKYQMIGTIILSIFSYLLSPLFHYGFDIALGLNVLAAAYSGYKTFRLHFKDENVVKTFFLALLSCAGFVVLKLLDLYLIHMSKIFYHLSGHFLSKLADILQIHYTNKFFFYVRLATKRQDKLCTAHSKSK